MNTLITDIQRFSLSDGDGIRTTVFFKGCNMNCSWCHNPETISFKRELMFYETKCIGCGKCFEVCPVKAHKVVDGKHIIDKSLCVACGKCAQACYAEALTMCGKEMSVEEIMKEIRQDIPYYNSSKGGVTLSGGEVMCHTDFATELIDACKKEGISVAVETNLNVPFKNIKSLLKKVDLIMCDLKIFSEEEHKKYTGVSNETIKANIKMLDALGVDIIIRTPLIPNVTDCVKNISDIAEFIKDMNNLRRYELLNFNPLGEGKYKALEISNDFEKCRPLKEDILAKLENVAKEKNIKVKVV